MHQVSITISGKVNSGKTTIAWALKQFCENAGFKVGEIKGNDERHNLTEDEVWKRWSTLQSNKDIEILIEEKRVA